MADTRLTTLEPHGILDRGRSGNREAGDEQCHRVRSRLEQRARKLFGRFPNVRPVADTGGVLRTGLMRLLRSLGRLRPGPTRDFYDLTAFHPRCELPDLTRRVAARPELRGRRRAADAPDGESPLHRVASGTAGDDDPERRSRYHEAVEALPVLEREVVRLSVYHGWTQELIAELFGVDERTIRRAPTPLSESCRRLAEAPGVEAVRAVAFPVR
jgi:RNA polymerase sigma factor (sigma-70 family)